MSSALPDSDRQSSKRADILRFAQALFSQRPDWVTYFREVLGLGGIVRQVYPTKESLAEFEKTSEYAQIQRMLAELRVAGPPVPEEQEPTRTITVRLPKSLHEFLQVEAYEHSTSLNQICISKLVQWLDSELAAVHESHRSPVDRNSLSFFFDLSDFGRSDVTDTMSFFSELYRQIGGDQLVIDGMGLCDLTAVPTPVGG